MPGRSFEAMADILAILGVVVFGLAGLGLVELLERL